MSYSAFQVDGIPVAELLSELQDSLLRGSTFVRFSAVTEIINFRTSARRITLSWSENPRIIGTPPPRILATAGGIPSAPSCDPGAIVTILLSLAIPTASLVFTPVVGGGNFGIIDPAFPTTIIGSVPAYVDPSDIGDVRDVPVPLGTDQTGSTFGGAAGTITVSATRPDPGPGFGGNGPPLQS